MPRQQEGQRRLPVLAAGAALAGAVQQAVALEEGRRACVGW